MYVLFKMLAININTHICGSIAFWLVFAKYHRVDPSQPNQNFLNRFIPIVFVDRKDMYLSFLTPQIVYTYICALYWY
jgi:hypothetical protein